MVAPIRILFLASNPQQSSSLRLDREMRQIDESLRMSEFRYQFEISQAWAVRIGDLQRNLLRYKPQIVHFSGHGSKSNQLIFEDEKGRMRGVSARALSDLFSIFEKSIRLVVLNACYSDLQAQAINQHIKFVIGMSDAIGDTAAIRFASSLYQGFGYGVDMLTAFRLARNAIDLENLGEEDTPKLLSGNSVPEEFFILDPQESVRPDIPKRQTETADIVNSRDSKTVKVVNLRPIDPNHTFYNRKREVEQLKDFLSQQKVRMIVVLGRSGIGKTALAGQWFSNLEEQRQLENNPFIDGIIYLSSQDTGLSLDRIYSDTLQIIDGAMRERLVSAWKDTETSIRQKTNILVSCLDQGTNVLLLDNLETYLSTEGEIVDEGLRLFIESCTTRASNIILIATSRFQINTNPNSLRSIRYIFLEDGLPEQDAISLLKELDPQGHLGIRDADDVLLKAAYELTQGVPRTLERLAGLLRQRGTTFDFQQLLGDYHAFSTNILDQFIHDSYTHLEDIPRRVLFVLSVFDRPVEIDAIRFVMGTKETGVALRDTLSVLVKSYLVAFDKVAKRYSLHPLDQEYYYHQLRLGGTLDSQLRPLERDVANYYKAIQGTPESYKDINDLDPQLSEFRHRYRAGDFEKAFHSIEQIWFQYLFRWGHYQLLEEMLEQLKGKVESPITNASILMALGRVKHARAEVTEGITLFEQALSFAQGENNTALEGEILYSIALAYREIGQIEKSLPMFQKSLTLAYENNDLWNANRRVGNLALTHHFLGNRIESTERGIEALRLARQVGDKWGIGVRLGILGMVALRENKLAEAFDYNLQGLQAGRALNDIRGISFRLVELGKTALFQNDVNAAIEYLNEAVTIDFKQTKYQGLTMLGIAYLILGEISLAEVNFQLAVEQCDARLQRSSKLFEPVWYRVISITGIFAFKSRQTTKHNLSNRVEEISSLYKEAKAICKSDGVLADVGSLVALMQNKGQVELSWFIDIVNN